MLVLLTMVVLLMNETQKFNISFSFSQLFLYFKYTRSQSHIVGLRLICKYDYYYFFTFLLALCELREYFSCAAPNKETFHFT